jgi:hypothetical protein
MVRRGVMCVLLLAAAQICGGCRPSVDPIEVASGCPGQPLRGPLGYVGEPANQLIADFEPRFPQLVPNNEVSPVAGRDGAWVLGWDTTSAAPIDEPSPDCAGRGKWAGHFAGHGFTSWGANWTAVFRATPSTSAVAYDGTGYGGLSFWAASVGGNGPTFEVPVGISTMDTAWNSSVCSPCTDHYMTKVALTGDWRRFAVRFDQMAQSGTGNPLVAMRRDQLVGFIIWPTKDFDIWIDDVRFEP